MGTAVGEGYLRALRVIRSFARALVRAADEQALLSELCRTVVHEAGYRLAWIGFAEEDEARSVRPAAHAGFEDGYLDRSSITWGREDTGLGPTGTAIRLGRTQVVRFIPTDPRFEPWREEAVRRGYASSVALPLRAAGTVLGALNVYAAEPDAFDSDEIALLEELAGDLSFGIVSMRTRSELERAQQELGVRDRRARQHERLEALGRLAATVAHDFNNLLAVIQAAGEHAQQRGATGVVAEDIADILSAAERAATLTTELLEFGRAGPGMPVDHDLDETLERLLPMVRRLLPDTVGLDLHLATEPVMVRADPSRVSQVVLNLATNARDAMPDGGELVIAVRGVQCGVQEQLPAGPYAELVVSDTGAGMSRATLERVFEPFFTTKGPGQGSGLGLSSAFGIVSAAGGRIVAESEPGRGTTMRVYLPRIV